MRISYLFYTKQGVRKSLSVQNAVLHQAQQVAVKSFSVFYSGCSQACVWCVEMVGLSVAATAGSTVVALIMQVLQVLGGWVRKGAFLCLDHRAQRDSMFRHRRKLIGYTYLVCLRLFGPLLPLFLPLREEIFPLSLISQLSITGVGE